MQPPAPPPLPRPLRNWTKPGRIESAAGRMTAAPIALSARSEGTPVRGLPPVRLRPAPHRVHGLGGFTEVAPHRADTRARRLRRQRSPSAGRMPTARICGPGPLRSALAIASL